jgi:hypothetical protein
VQWWRVHGRSEYHRLRVSVWKSRRSMSGKISFGQLQLTGATCSQFADACATNPCLPTERCDQTGSQYQCKTRPWHIAQARERSNVHRLGTSCYDQSTFCSVYQTLTVYCDNRYTLLVNNTFVPVLQACQRSCGQCTSGQRSNNTRALLGMINEDVTWLEENHRRDEGNVHVTSNARTRHDLFTQQKM